MATSQASTAAAVGRASRLDTRDHLATLAGKERNPLGIGTMAPARGGRGTSSMASRSVQVHVSTDYLTTDTELSKM